MKSVFALVLLLGSVSFAVDYQCVADHLQAYNSDIYYNLSPSEIDVMLKDASAIGHDKAVEAVNACENKTPEKCFKAKGSVYGLPQTICLKSAVYTQGQRQDTLQLNGSVNLTSDNVVWSDYDSQIVLGSFKFVENFETCGSSLKSTLYVRAKIDYTGEPLDLDRVSLSVSYSETNDSCHSVWTAGTLDYVPAK